MWGHMYKHQKKVVECGCLWEVGLEVENDRPS